jgi:hypothetical protein
MRNWLRSYLTYANVMVTILAFIVLGGMSYAATGGNFILGQSNSASSTTSLTRTGANTGKGLQVTNNSTTAGAAALGLNVASGHAPFTVNSGTKVANLNADKLDGLDSTSFVPGSKLRRVGPIVDTVPPSGGFFDSPIATVGHFTFKGHCGFLPPSSGDLGQVRLTVESDVAHSTYASLTQSQAGGEFGNTDMAANTEYTVANIGPTSTSNFPEFNPATGSAVAPDGQQVTFDVYQGAGARTQSECIYGGTFAGT